MRYSMSDSTRLFLLLSMQSKGVPLPQLSPEGPVGCGNTEVDVWVLQDLILDSLMKDPFYRPPCWAGQDLHPSIEPAYFQAQFRERILRLQAERSMYVRNLSSQLDLYIALYDKLEVRRTGYGCAGTTWGGSMSNSLRIWESPEYQCMVLQSGLRARYETAASSSCPAVFAGGISRSPPTLTSQRSNSSGKHSYSYSLIFMRLFSPSRERGLLFS